MNANDSILSIADGDAEGLQAAHFVQVGEPLCTCDNAKYSGCLKHGALTVSGVGFAVSSCTATASHCPKCGQLATAGHACAYAWNGPVCPKHGPYLYQCSGCFQSKLRKAAHSQELSGNSVFAADRLSTQQLREKLG